MSADTTFKIRGRGYVPISNAKAEELGKADGRDYDDLDVRIQIQIDRAIERCITKAVVDDRVLADGELSQSVLGEKLGALDPAKSGIMAKHGEFLTMGHVFSTTGFGSGQYAGHQYADLDINVRLTALQTILVNEGALVLPVEPEPVPEPEPAPTPETQEDPSPPPPASETEPPSPPAPEPDEDFEFDDDDFDLEGDLEDSAEEAVVIPLETHIVTTKKDPLRIRSGPSMRDKIVGRMPKGTKVRVIDEYLGKNCKWHKIEMVDVEARDARSPKQLLVEKFKDRSGALYSHGAYLTKIEGRSPSLPYTCEVKIEPNAVPRDWKTLDPMAHCCYYNKKTGEYQVTIELPYTSEEELETDYGGFENVLLHVLETGIQKLLNYYAKQNDAEAVSKIYNAFKGAYVPSGADGFYLDKRPGSFMRFMVAFPAKYFDAFPDRLGDVTPMSEPSRPDKSYHFAWSVLREKAEFVAKQMDKYAEEIEAFDGEIEFLDLKAEAKRLREVPDVLEEFLSINGHPPSKMKHEWTVEVGMTDEFQIEWVLLNVDDKKAFPLEVSFGRMPSVKEVEEGAVPPVTTLYSELYPDGFGFQFVEPINNPRTVAYLYYLDRMVEAIKSGTIPKGDSNKVGGGKTDSNKLTWTEFVNAFTYPIPRILPSAEPEVEDDKSSEKVNKEKEKKHTKPAGEAKTTSEVKKETDDLGDIGTKLKQAWGRAQNEDFIGDSLFADIEYVLRRIVRGGSLDGIYDELLNKYSLPALAMVVLSCLMRLIPFEKLQNLGLEKVIDALPTDQVEEIIDTVKNINPAALKKAMETCRSQIEKAKEQGFAPGVPPFDFDAFGELPPEIAEGLDASSEGAANSVDGSGEYISTFVESATSKAGFNADASEMLSPSTSGDNQPPVALSVESAGYEGTGMELSTTKIGKSENYLKGIDDFGASTLLEGSGASISGNLSPDLKKQVMGASQEFGGILNEHLPCMQNMLKEILKSPEKQIKDLIKNTLEDLAPDEIKNVLGSLSKVSVDIAEGKRSPPEIPGVDLPDNMSTSDPMADITPMIEEAIEDALIAALMGVIREVLMELKKVIDDLCSGKIPDYGRAKNLVPSDAQRDALDKLGLGGITPDEQFNNFVNNDLAGSLTGSEMADLLSGRVGEETAQFIGALARNRYPDLYPALLNVAAIEEMFGTLGKFVPNEIIRETRTPLVAFSLEGQTFNMTGLLCDDDGTFEKDYSGRLSGERAKEQSDAELKRLSDLARKISDLVDNVDSAFGPVGTIPGAGGLAGLGSLPGVPALGIGGPCDDGLLPDIPSLNAMNNLVIGSAYTSVRMAFGTDLGGFTDKFITKEVKTLAPGDPGHSLPGVLNTYTEKWSELRADKENKERARTMQHVAPNLKIDLRTSTNFANVKPDDPAYADDCWSIKFIASQIKVPEIPTTEKGGIIEEMEAELQRMKDRLVRLKDIQEELTDEGLVDHKIEAEIVILAAPIKGEQSYNTRQGGPATQEEHGIGKLDREPGSIDDYRQQLHEVRIELLADKGIGSEDEPGSIEGVELKQIPVVSMVYDIIRGDSPPTGLVDNYRLRVTDSPVDKELNSTLTSAPKPAPSLATVSDSWEPSESPPQQEAWASFLLSKLDAAGAVWRSTAPEPQQSPVYAFLKQTQQGCMVDFLRKVAKQISRSPLFELEGLETVRLLPELNSASLCSPGGANDDEDLLDIYKITQDTVREYEEQCEPLGRAANITSVLETTIRAGVVKMATRVFMIETMLRSIFSITEFDVEKMAGERLFIDFINHRMKEDLNRFNPGFYRDISVAAREMIKKRAADGVPIENLFNVIDMDALLNEGNPLWASGEEALKYLAMEQLPSLLSTMESKVGSKTPSIYRRFTDPPPSGSRDWPSESTPAGTGALIPKGDKGGWIRTIDVPRARNYGGDNLDVQVNDGWTQDGNRFLMTHQVGSTEWATTLTENKIILRYPDLAKSSGTFFVEKYIRIEDKSADELGPLLVTPLAKAIRERGGGPDDPVAGNGRTHLSGVVNVAAWQEFLAGLEMQDNQENPTGFETAKISDYFKPWKYGLRLIWLPPMDPAKGGFQNVGRQEWRRFVSDDIAGETASDVLADILEGIGMGSATAALATMAITATAGKIRDITEDPLVIIAAAVLGFSDINYSDMAIGDAGWGDIDDLLQFIAPEVDADGSATNIIEALMPVTWDPTDPNNISLARREKAYFLEEEITLLNTKTGGMFGLDWLPGVNEYLYVTEAQTWRRPVFTFPLAAVERNIGDASLKKYAASDGFDSNSDIEINPDSPLAKLRVELLDSPDFKSLFEYAFPMQRMISLITIYNSNSMVLSQPELLDAFTMTKEALRSTFYTLSPVQDEKEWWERENEFVTSVGGNAGLMQMALQGDTSKGPDFASFGIDINLLSLAAMTVPRLIRGIAEYVDPHYGTVSKLVDLGIWPLPKTWVSVFPLWPSTFPLPWMPLVGWGPALGMWGAMAYGMPQLRGDRNKQRRNIWRDKTVNPREGEDPCPEENDETE